MAIHCSDRLVYNVSTGIYSIIINNKEYLVIQKYLENSNTLSVNYIENFNNKLKLV